MATAFSDATSGISAEADNPTHYVDWGAIAAGVFVSLAVSSVFVAFGSAIGLSVTSFQPSASAPVAGIVIAAGLWLLWVRFRASSAAVMLPAACGGASAMPKPMKSKCVTEPMA
jgi:hypothetical protein